MKNLLFLLAFLPSILIAQQQPFGQGATWHWEFFEYGYTGYLSLSHVGDTTLNGLVWQKFKKGGIRHLQTGPDPYNDVLQSPISGYYFLMNRNDSVFTMSQDSTPQLIYDFSAQIGDSWQYAPADTGFGCTDLPIATVVDIGYDTIQGQPAKYWLVEGPMDTINQGGTMTYGCSSVYCLGGKIYRDFGGFFYNMLFGPTANACNGVVFKSQQLNTYQLRCFSNANISFNRTNRACDYWSKIGIDENEINKANVFPNPTIGAVFLESESAIDKVEVYNVSGQKVNTVRSENTLELPESKGLYFLHITYKNGAVQFEKVVKH